MEEFTAYTVERIKSKKQLVFNISCDVVFNSFKTLKYAQRSKAIALYAAVLICLAIAISLWLISIVSFHLFGI